MTKIPPLSVFLGILSTLFCIEGIKGLRWLATISFPILVIAFLGIIFFTSPEFHFKDHDKISLSGLPIILATSLGVTADLPTFFRHSNSWRDSVIGLSAIQVLSFFMGLGGLFLGEIIEPWLGISQGVLATGLLLKIFLVVWIFFSVICVNVASVYSSSVGWELVAPVLAGEKEYLILGLGLTIVFILVSNIFSLNFLADTSGSALVNLSMVFALGYLKHFLTKKPPNSFEQKTYFFAWIIATTINILQYSKLIFQNILPIVTAFFVILLIIALSKSLNQITNCFTCFLNHKRHRE